MPQRGNATVQETVYLVMTEFWLRKLFPTVIFLNSSVPENCYKIFFKKMKFLNYLLITLTYFSVICLIDTQIVQMSILRMADIDRLIIYDLQSFCHSTGFSLLEEIRGESPQHQPKNCSFRPTWKNSPQQTPLALPYPQILIFFLPYLQRLIPPYKTTVFML